MNEVEADAVMNDADPTTAAAALPSSDPPRTAAKRLGKKRTSQDKISQLVKFKKVMLSIHGAYTLIKSAEFIEAEAEAG
jgi:hypothetical protein